jgi:agmatine/peptidylarginine deiminase
MGRRLAASYANFLIVNGAVLMPAYGDPPTMPLRRCWPRPSPDREIVQVPAAR